MNDGDNLVAGDFGKLQELMAKYGPLHASGGPVPLEYWRAWQGTEPDTPGTTGKLNPATGMVDYTLQDDAGFLGEFLNMAKIPALFAGAAGLGGLANGFLGGLSGAGSAAGEIAALTGSGGSGAGFGLSSGAAGGLGSIADLPWGVNQQGGSMDYSDFLQEFGFSPDAAAGFYEGPMSLNGAGVFNDPFKLGNLTELVKNPSILQTIKNATGLGGSDLVKLVGQLGAAGLGAYGANQQANSLQGLADKYSEFGAPYRAMLAQSYADPNAFLANSPDINAAVNQGTNATARALSVNGNPAGSGRALQEIQNYATQGLYGQLGNERNRLANFGGLSNFNAASPGLETQAIGQQGNVLNALGYGLNQISNPTPSLNDLWKSLNLGGLS